MVDLSQSYRITNFRPDVDDDDDDDASYDMSPSIYTREVICTTIQSYTNQAVMER